MDKEMLEQVLVFARSWELLKSAYRDTVEREDASADEKEIASDMLSIMDDIESQVSETYRKEDLTKEEEVE